MKMSLIYFPEDSNMSSFSRPDRYRTPTFTRATHLGTFRPDLDRDSGFSGLVRLHHSTVTHLLGFKLYFVKVI